MVYRFLLFLFLFLFLWCLCLLFSLRFTLCLVASGCDTRRRHSLNRKIGNDKTVLRRNRKDPVSPPAILPLSTKSLINRIGECSRATEIQSTAQSLIISLSCPFRSLPLSFSYFVFRSLSLHIQYWLLYLVLSRFWPLFFHHPSRHALCGLLRALRRAIFGKAEERGCPQGRERSECERVSEEVKKTARLKISDKSRWGREQNRRRYGIHKKVERKSGRYARERKEKVNLKFKRENKKEKRDRMRMKKNKRNGVRNPWTLEERK